MLFRSDAAREGSKEIELAVLASSFTNVAVFVPIAFTSGIVGQFFRQFGLTVTFANLLSVFMAFTLTPMLSGRWLRKRDPSRTRLARFFDRWDAAYDRFTRRYQGWLAWCLRHPAATLGIAMLAFVVSIILLASRSEERRVGKECRL